MCNKPDQIYSPNTLNMGGSLCARSEAGHAVTMPPTLGYHY